MKIKSILVTYSKLISKKEKLVVEGIKKHLKEYKAEINFIEREKLRKDYFKNCSLVIAIGGDGTFLRASHFVLDSIPILGVNSDPKSKEGFFMKSNEKDFKIKFERIIDNDFKIKKLSRLEAFINNKKVPDLALNEFYIGPGKVYEAARYTLHINGMKEKQKSSGIIVSTSTGSNAWIRYFIGKPLPLESRKFLYAVREPYKGKLTGNYKLLKGILNKNQKVEIISDMKKGIVVADSLSMEYFFGKNSRIKIRLSDKDISMIYF